MIDLQRYWDSKSLAQVWICSKETHAQRVPQRRRRIHLGEFELRETNSCVSFVVCLTTLSSSIIFVIPHRSTLVCCFCVCRDLQHIYNHLQEHYTKLYLC